MNMLNFLAFDVSWSNVGPTYSCYLVYVANGLEGYMVILIQIAHNKTL